MSRHEIEPLEGAEVTTDPKASTTEQFGDGLLEHLLDAVITLKQTASRQSDILKSLARRVADLEESGSTSGSDQ